MLGKLDIRIQNNEVGPLPNTIYKNSGWIKDLNAILEKKTLRRIYRTKLHDIRFGYDFLDRILKAKVMKERN